MKLNTESTSATAQQPDQIDNGQSANSSVPLASSRLGVRTDPADRPSCSPQDIPTSNTPTDESEPDEVKSPAGRRRRGGIARLSKELRQAVNEMLDDGYTYSAVIAGLGEDGKALNVDIVRRWKQGGYRDYLRDQKLAEQCRRRLTDVSSLLADRGHVSGFQATQQIASNQIMAVLAESGVDFLREALNANPMNYFRMLNAFTRISTGGLKCERHQLEQKKMEAETSQAKTPREKPGISDEAVAEMKAKLALL